MDQACLKEIVKDILLSLNRAIKEKSFSIAGQITFYLEEFLISDAITHITESLNPQLASFIEGITNNFENLNLDLLEQELDTAEQGVYAGIVRNEFCQTYIGSAWSERGLRRRVFNQHKFRRYREKYSSKVFYDAWGKPGSQVSFLCLIKFRRVVHAGLILLADAVCCVLFGSLDNPIYRQARSHALCLPTVNWKFALNSSNPLAPAADGEGNRNLHNDAVTYHRLQHLENCLNSGPKTVYLRSQGIRSKSWDIRLFAQKIAIPVKIARKWQLTDRCQVFVQWEVLERKHPDAFAPMASDEDPGKGIGIRFFRPGSAGQPSEGFWKTLKSPDAVRVANFLYDFLKGNIVGKNYAWNLKKVKYAFHKPRYLKGATGQKIDRARPLKPIRYDTDFRFGDPENQPETMPTPMEMAEEFLARRQMHSCGDQSRIKPTRSEIEPPSLSWPSETQLLDDLRARRRSMQSYPFPPDYRKQFDRTDMDKLTYSDIANLNGFSMIVDHLTPARRGYPVVGKGQLLIYLQHFSGILKRTEAHQGEFEEIGTSQTGSEKAPRRTARGRAKPDAAKVLQFLLSNEALDLCRPDDEIKALDGNKQLRTYSESELNPFEELLSAVVLSRPISHALGVRTIRTVLNEPYQFTSPKAILDAGPEKVHQSLWDARTQHKDKTAHQLSDLADIVSKKFSKDDASDTSLSGVRNEAGKDMDKESGLLTSSIKGIGKTGMSIFFRRVQWLWEECYPYIDNRTGQSLEELGLPKDAQKLVKLVDENWDVLKKMVAVGKDDEAKKRRAFVVVLERAIGAGLEKNAQAVLERV